MVLVGLVASLGIFFWWQGVPATTNPSLNVAASEPVLAVKPVNLMPAAPVLLNGAWPINTSADSFGVAFVPATLDNTQILIEKNSREPVPIASLTKLLTAAVSLSRYPLDTPVTVNPAALVESPDAGFLRSGDQFTLAELLRMMLVESSNNAAYAVAELEPPGQFIDLMNETVRGWGLTTSTFFNPSGLDPQMLSTEINQSSATDLLRLAVYLLREQPEVWELSRQFSQPVYSADGQFHHEIKPTNQLLVSSAWSSQMVGGKTGQTERAKKNLLVVLRQPELEGYLVAVVLGSADHFRDMDNLLRWVYQSYKF